VIFLSERQIVVLTDKEQARKRINVFHGSANNYINLIKELVGNSHDIFDKSTLNTIKIILHNSNKIEYIDSGSGIPIEGTASDGRPNYEAIFERAFAGSHYNNDTASIGQNGIFLYTLSMTCEDIEYFIARPNGNLYNIGYHKGDRVKELNVIGKEDKTYSRIIFSADNEVWNNPKFTYEEICNICKAQVCLGNMKITVEDKQNNLLSEFYYPNGIEDYFKEMTENKSTVIDDIKINKSIEYEFDKSINGEKTKFKDNIEIELLFNYSNDSEDDFQKEFLNTADLLLHGTIQDGVFVGLKNTIHKWLKDNNKYDKNEKPITLDDVSTGLNYICNMSSRYVEYDNQIKQKTSVLHYKDVLQNCINDYMEIFFIENSTEAFKLCNQVLINSRVRLKADQSRLNIKKMLEGNSKSPFGKIEGLTDCDKNAPFEQREIWICEGLSACSTLTDSRDDETMATYALRGRFINSLKSTVEDVLNNDPAYGLIQALKCGIEAPLAERKKFKNIELFNKENLKYNRIIIATDADSFGHGITLSLISFFYKFMRTLLKEGHIYIAVSPRYQINHKDKLYFAYSEEEKNKIVTEHNINPKSSQIAVIKGLGQLNVDVFWNNVMNPENRILKRVVYEDLTNEEDVEFYFNTLMGEDISERKDYVKEFITNTNIEEID
jgi:DNA gyrase subunit B